MTPYEQARAVYLSEPCARTFEEDLGLHLARGFVFSTPKYFIMGRPVQKEVEAWKIVDPSVYFPPELCNCWHVFVMAGDVSKVWDILPWPLGTISFERRNELRFYSAERIRRLSCPDHANLPD